MRRVQNVQQRLETESTHSIGAMQVWLWQFSVGSLFSYLPPLLTVFEKAMGGSKGKVVEVTRNGARVPGFESQLYHILACFLDRLP